MILIQILLPVVELVVGPEERVGLVVGPEERVGPTRWEELGKQLGEELGEELGGFGVRPRFVRSLFKSYYQVDKFRRFGVRPRFV